ncbi:MAG: SDR family NAD(P)-dependent oxidoreductase [Thermoanaerobaculia bacterium]
MTRPIALVTGASSGIGLELATLLARDGHDLVFVARSRERLEDIARGLHEEYGASATVIARDLADPDSPRAVAQEVEARGLLVEVLVNDAGLGLYGPFAETPLEKELAMIQVNLVALTELTKRLLPGMLQRRRGRILNVASTAAFQPGPLMAVYYAAKAYVLSFTEALAEETAGTGVTVTALCPGPTKTEFQKQAGLEMSLPLLRSPLVLDVKTVALTGYRGMMRGKRVVIPGWANKLQVQAVRFTPRRLVTALARRAQETRRPGRGHASAR